MTDYRVRVHCPDHEHSVDLHPRYIVLMLSASDPSHTFYRFACTTGFHTVDTNASPDVVKLLLEAGVKPIGFDIDTRKPGSGPISGREVVQFCLDLAKHDCLVDLMATATEDGK